MHYCMSNAHSPEGILSRGPHSSFLQAFETSLLAMPQDSLWINILSLVVMASCLAQGVQESNHCYFAEPVHRFLNA